jgi:hypothetical protein
MCISHFQPQQHRAYRVQLSWVLNFNDAMTSKTSNKHKNPCRGKCFVQNSRCLSRHSGSHGSCVHCNSHVIAYWIPLIWDSFIYPLHWLLWNEKKKFHWWSTKNWTLKIRRGQNAYTRWFKYDRDWLCANKSQFVPVVFEPPCIIK